MPNTFYAFCRTNNENPIYRIPITREIQDDLEQLFYDQEQSFLANRDEEVNFNGDWKPESNQLLIIENEELAKPFARTFERTPAAYEQLDIEQIENTGIKGIFTHANSGNRRILLQRFQTSQYLQRGRTTLIFSNARFGRFSDNGFALDTKLTAIVEQNSFKFVSFSNLRTIIPIQDHFLEATSEEVTSLKECQLFYVQDEDYFDTAMDEGSRKIIRRITRSGVLNDYNFSEIRDRASSVGLEIESHDDKLVLPNDKREIKTILRFLDESVYRGTFSNETFETNSKRQIE